MKERLSVRVDSERLEKLRRVAKQKRKTMTQLIEDWIDRLQEEKSPAYGRGFKPSFSVKTFLRPARVEYSTIQRAGGSNSHVNACRLDAPDSHLDSQSKISYYFHSSPGQHKDLRF